MTIHFSPEFVRMVAWALLHFVWQGAAVAALLSIVLAVSKRAAVRYAAGVAALALMMVLPFVTFLALQTPAGPATVESSIESAMPASVMSASPAQAAALPAIAPRPSEAPPQAMLWVVRLWMFGVVLFSLRSLGGFVLVQRLRRAAGAPVTGDLLALCMAVQRRMRIDRAVRFCRSAALQVPAVVGGLRPIVLLPISALTGLSDAQIEAIVAHELAHIRRLDYFVNIFQVLAETVLFYHPAVWWVNKRIRIERENCCDDAAIELCRNRLAYVRALTHLESVRLTPQFAMAANGSPLKARVRRLLGMAEERGGMRTSSSVLGVLGIVSIMLIGTSLATGAKAQADKPPLPPQEPVAPQLAPAPQKPIDIEVPPVHVEVPPVHVQTHVQIPEVDVPPVHVAVPAIHVATEPVHVRVPMVNVDSNGVQVHIPEIHIDAPALHLNLSPINLNLPSIHLPHLVSQAVAPDPPQGPAETPSSEAHASGSYIEDMKSEGYGNLTVDQLVAMKVQGVTPAYARAFRDLGLKLSPNQLIALKVQGVKPEYVKELRAMYPDIGIDHIIAFKVQGISESYVADFNRLGVKADPDELIALKVQGVNAQYVHDMRATGIDFDADELIGMKVQGVTPSYVSALKAAGLPGLRADEIIGAKVMGITPQFVEKAKSHGFQGLDLEKLIALKNSGVL